MAPAITDPPHRARFAAHQERLGLIDGRVVGGVLDHVQRPAVAHARGLSDPHRRCEVMSSPDERRGSRDPPEDFGRNRRHCEQLHELAPRFRHRRRVGELEVVRLHRVPARTQRLPQTLEVEGASLPQTVVGVCGRLREETHQRRSKLGRGFERRQTERVHEHQSAEPLAVIACEAGSDRASEQMSDEDGRRRAGALDQLGEPCDHSIDVELAGGHRRGALAGQVGRDHAMGRHQPRDHPHPRRRVRPGAVEQNNGRTSSTLEYRG